MQKPEDKAAAEKRRASSPGAARHEPEMVKDRHGRAKVIRMHEEARSAPRC